MMEIKIVEKYLNISRNYLNKITIFPEVSYFRFYPFLLYSYVWNPHAKEIKSEIKAEKCLMTALDCWLHSSL